MRILFITKIQTLPVDGGEKIRSFGLLYCLQKLGHDVTVIAPDSDTSDPDGEYIRDVKFVSHKLNHMCLAFPFIRDRDLMKKIRRIHAETPLDLTILDYQYLGQYIGWFKHQGIPVIYGTHNAQAHLDVQRISGRPLHLKIPQLIYAGLVFLHERHYFNKADLLWVTSPEDAEYHRSFVNERKLIELPNFLVTEKYCDVEAIKQDYIVLTANFNSFQNQAGLEWFLKEVWDDELAGLTRLVLVGNKSDHRLEECRSKGYCTQNVEATGFVESVNGYVSGARMSVVPLLHGSGTRLKIIEALALKTLVVSTTVGATGIREGLVSIADTPMAFKAEIKRLLADDSGRAHDAYEAFIQYYSSESASVIVKESLSAVC